MTFFTKKQRDGIQSDLAEVRNETKDLLKNVTITFLAFHRAVILGAKLPLDVVLAVNEQLLSEAKGRQDMSALAEPIYPNT
jgi:hypothetical protein